MICSTRAVRRIAFAAAFSCFGIVAGHAEPIALDKVPAAAQASIKKLVGTNKIESLSKEEEDGKATFELEYYVGDTDHYATIGEGGKVIREGVDVDATEIPPKIAAAIKKAHPDAKTQDISKMTQNGKVYYDVNIKADGAARELEIREDGTLVSDSLSEPDENAKPEKPTKTIVR